MAGDGGVTRRRCGPAPSPDARLDLAPASAIVIADARCHDEPRTPRRAARTTASARNGVADDVQVD
jgi:hypothetical protein